MSINRAAPAPAPGGVLASNEFGTYSVPVASAWRPAAKTVLAGQVWERRTIEYMARNAAPGDILHAGAYFGDFLPALSTTVRRGALVWAFEPNPENFAHACRTIELNGLRNVVLRQTALGSAAQIGKLRTANHAGAALGGASRLIAGDAPARGALVAVNVERIDDVLPGDRKLGIVQLDLEGHELQALKGALATIERCRPLVIIEANKPAADCVRLLAGFRYAALGRLGPNLVIAPAEAGRHVRKGLDPLDATS